MKGLPSLQKGSAQGGAGLSESTGYTALQTLLHVRVTWGFLAGSPRLKWPGELPFLSAPQAGRYPWGCHPGGKRACCCFIVVLRNSHTVEIPQSPTLLSVVLDGS